MRLSGRKVDSLLAAAVDGFVVLFGFWSLISQAAVLAGASGDLLAKLSLLAPGLAVAAFLVSRRRKRMEGPATRVEGGGAAGEPLSPAWLFLALALILALFYAWTGLYLPLWIGAAALLAVAYIRNAAAPSLRIERPGLGPVGIVALGALTAVVLAAVLCSHRPHNDDSLYLSVAVSVHDRPGAPLMASDTLDDDPGQPFLAPQHKLRTYDVLVGLTARWLGIEPIAAAHLLFPPLFALIFIAAAARLLRLLLGRAWLYGLAALIVLLLANGDVDTSYGNTAFVLLFQGKAILTTVMVPILAAYGIELGAGLRPPAVMAGLLVLALAGSVSLSTNALFMGPVAAGLAMAGAWRPDRRHTIRILAGGLLFIYPFGLGLLLKGTSVPELFYQTDSPSWLGAANRGMNLVLGWRPFELFWLAALLGGWTIFPDRARRRLLAGSALIFVLLFMNPLLTSFWAANLTSTVTFFRLYWALPLPFFLASLLSAGPLRVSRAHGPAAAAVFAAVLAAFAAIVPARWTISPLNRVRIAVPGLKVHPTLYPTAVLLAGKTPRGRSVLAPEHVAEWIPTLSGHPSSVVSRRMYLSQKRSRMSPAEFRRRALLVRYVSGTVAPEDRLEARAAFIDGLEGLRIGGVAVKKSTPWLGEADALLKARGFRRIASPSAHFLLYVLRN